MSTIVSLPLFAGQRLKREEFLRRWEAMPYIKNAELIGGVVYMASPVSSVHGSHDGLLISWLVQYAIRTPGSAGGANRTWLVLEDAPQPDADLVVLPEYGGQSRLEGAYCAGAPELAAEICLSSASYDLGPKLELYQAADVREYVAVIYWRAQGLVAFADPRPVRVPGALYRRVSAFSRIPGTLARSGSHARSGRGPCNGSARARPALPGA